MIYETRVVSIPFPVSELTWKTKKKKKKQIPTIRRGGDCFFSESRGKEAVVIRDKGSW